MSLAAIVLLALGAIACGGSDAATTPTTPTTTRTTDTFSGSVDVNGSAFHTFSVSQTGEVDVTLTAAVPPTIVMGIGLGIVADSLCARLPGASATVQTGTSTQLSGIVTAGTLCAEIFDVGNLAAPVGYTITVTHP